MFPDVAQIQLICSDFSLISVVTTLQKALVMMQVSGQSFPVSVSVIICLFVFELQWESSANMFHVFD